MRRSKAASERGQTKARFQYAEREQARPKVKGVGSTLVYRIKGVRRDREEDGKIQVKQW